jgi:hypothetical protein
MEPEELSFEKWCKLYAEWQYITKINHQNQKAAIIDAAAEIINAITQNVGTNNQLDT